ncbi:KRAB-A domain-containing protein, partial [Fasciola hepatica]
NDQGHPPRIVVPRALVAEVVAQTLLDTGHVGQCKKEAAIRQSCWWPTIHRDVTAYRQNCKVCQRVKNLTPQRKARLQPVTSQGPNHRVGIDIVGPLPLPKQGHRYIPVFVDYFTKRCEQILLNSRVCIRSPRPLFVGGYVVAEQHISFTRIRGQHSKTTCLKLFSICYTLLRLELRPTTLKATDWSNEPMAHLEILCKQLSIVISRTNRTRICQWPSSPIALHLILLSGFPPLFFALGMNLDSHRKFSHHWHRRKRSIWSPLSANRSNVCRPPFELRVTQYKVPTNIKNLGMIEVLRTPKYATGDLALLYRSRPAPGVSHKLNQPWQNPYIIVYQRSLQV